MVSSACIANLWWQTGAATRSRWREREALASQPRSGGASGGEGGATGGDDAAAAIPLSPTVAQLDGAGGWERRRAVDLEMGMMQTRRARSEDGPAGDDRSLVV